MSESILTVSESLLSVPESASMPGFALLIILTLCTHYNLMHVLIGMQTLVPPPT